MKKLLGVLLFLLCSMPAFGQSKFGTITAASTDCSVANSCVSLLLNQAAGGATITLTGTWSATLNFEVSGDNGVTWAAASTASSTTIGVTNISVAGYTNLRVRCNPFTSGTVNVTIYSGTGSIRGSSSSGTSQGPVINVTNTSYAGGASSSNADNNAAFTAASAAANTAPAVQGPAPIGVPVVAHNSGAGVSSLAVTITIPAGNTTYLVLSDAQAQRGITVSDSGGSIYSQLGTDVNNVNAGRTRLFATAPGGTKASTSVTVTVTSGGAETIVASVISYPNVTASLNTTSSIGTGTTALSASQTTLKPASTMLLACSFFNTNISSATATTGTVRDQLASTAIAGGVLFMDNASTPIASVTNAGTFSLSTNWNCYQTELQTAGGVGLPTLYVPSGFYTYSGGLSMTQPMTLKCEPGAILNYTGNAHAVDVGPNTLSVTNAQKFYFVDGCEFTGGANMTQGVFLNQWVIIAGVRNTTFYNFGAPSTGPNSSHMLAAQCDNWDMEVGPQVRVVTDDYTPRNFFRPNLGACDSTSFVRVHDIEMYCLQGTSPGNSGGCNANNAGIGIQTDGAEGIISHNSLAFFNPDIYISCSVTPCLGTVIDNNLINNPNAAGSGTILPQIQFDSNTDGLVIQHNRFDMHFIAAGTSPIGPRSGTVVAAGFRFNFNNIDEFTGQATTPVLQLNNLASQTNNQSSNNLCSVNYGAPFIPCPVSHTTGANISNFTFNVDDQHLAGLYATTTNCSSSAGTCVAAPAGAVSIAAAASTVTVTTTAVTANSQIILSRDDTLGTKLGVTCNTATAAGDIKVSTRTAATSFVITVQNAPVTNPLCLNYWIVN